MFARPATIAMITVFLGHHVTARSDQSPTPKRRRSTGQKDRLSSSAPSPRFCGRAQLHPPLPDKCVTSTTALESLGGLVLAGLVLTMRSRAGPTSEPGQAAKIWMACAKKPAPGCLMVPLLGLPITSTAYAGVLMVRARAGYLQVALSTLGFGLLPVLAAVCIAVDVRSKPHTSRVAVTVAAFLTNRDSSSLPEGRQTAMLRPL